MGWNSLPRECSPAHTLDKPFTPICLLECDVIFKMMKYFFGSFRKVTFFIIVKIMWLFGVVYQ